MKRWAVSCINWSDSDLRTLIVEAEDWRNAAMQHPQIAEGFALEETEDKPRLPDDQEKAKEEAFDQDMMIEVVEIV